MDGFACETFAELIPLLLSVLGFNPVIPYGNWLHSIDFLKELLALARAVVEAEKQVDPKDEREKAKAALSELLSEAKAGNTPVVAVLIVADIDEIVRMGRFPGWQDTHAGEREVQNALRKIIYVKYKIKDQDLFDKAYGYIRQYY